MMQQRPGMRRLVPLMDDGRTPQLWEDETVDFVLSRVELAFTLEERLGAGTLFITSKRVVWVGENGSNCDLDVPFIIMHAVSRDSDTFPKPCLYCQLDCDEGCEDELSELFLAPEEEVDLMKIFDALSHAALINPDPAEDGEEEGDDELIFDAEEVRLGAEQARVLDHLESVFNVPAEFQQEGEQISKRVKTQDDATMNT